MTGKVKEGFMGNVQKEIKYKLCFYKKYYRTVFFTEIRDASLYSNSFNFTMKQKKIGKLIKQCNACRILLSIY